MYRHEKIPPKTTALFSPISGFDDNPAELFQAEMQRVAGEMQTLPFYRHGIECFCPPFVLFEEQWVGVALTPWMLSLLILPGPQQLWEPRELGDKITVQLPYKALTFTVSGIDNVPQYLSCSLQSPLEPHSSHPQAVQLAKDCLRMILSLPTKQPAFDPDRRNLFKAMIK